MPGIHHIALVLTTVDTRITAKSLAHTLLTERLAGCITQIPVQSTYRWKDKIEESEEIKLVFKTSPSRGFALIERIKALHPYETPEILHFNTVDASESYKAWIEAETSPIG